MFDKGVDYIDIIGEINDEQDTVGISFSKEYMNKDMQENFDDVSEEGGNEENSPLSDDDLNQLI